MDVAQIQKKSRRLPRPTALGTLAVIGVVAILSGTVAGPYLGWKAYRQSQQTALVKGAQTAWNDHWKDAKDADGKPVSVPPLQGLVNYPTKSFLFIYQDPSTGKPAATVWMSNQELAQAALKDVWVPLGVQEQAPPTAPAATPEAGK